MIFKLFNNSVSTAEIIQHQTKWKGDHKCPTDKDLREVVVAYFKEFSSYSPGKTGGNYDKSQSGQLITRPSFEHDTSKMKMKEISAT